MAARDSLIDTIKTRVVQGGSSGRRHTQHTRVIPRRVQCLKLAIACSKIALTCKRVPTRL